MAVKAKFVGDGTAHVAQSLEVPGRDLSDEEWAAMTDEQRAAVLSTKDSAGKLLYSVTRAASEREALGLTDAPPAANPAVATAAGGASADSAADAPATRSRAKSEG